MRLQVTYEKQINTVSSMRTLSVILSTLLLVVGLASCRGDKPTPVVTEATSLTLSPTAITLQVGKTQQLTVTVQPAGQIFTATFTSDKPEVATVDAKGLITAVAEGTAHITAQVGKLTQQCVVTVSNTAPAVKLEVETTVLSIKKGGNARINYTVTPADTPVTFTSDKTDIATVDAQGLVTGVAAGSATIAVSAAGQSASVAVTVTEDQGGGATDQTELPLLKFAIEQDAQGVPVDADVLKHEQAVGRTLKPVTIGKGPDGGDLTFPGFVNTALTITGAVYGLSIQSGEKVIIAFSKESLAACPRTQAMLADYGFDHLEQSKFQNGTPCKIGTKSDNSSIQVTIYDEPNSELQSTLIIEFLEKRELPTAHPILPNAKDFPDYATFATGDVAKIKEFESTLGFRNFDAEKSNEDAKNLLFETKQESIPESNFQLVYYVSSAKTKFINSIVNVIKGPEDFADPKLKEWFTTNGYGNKFETHADKGYAYGWDASSKIFCQIFIKEGVTFIQIFEKQQSQSASQMRRLAFEQYKTTSAQPQRARYYKFQHRR